MMTKQPHKTLAKITAEPILSLAYRPIPGNATVKWKNVTELPLARDFTATSLAYQE